METLGIAVGAPFDLLQVFRQNCGECDLVIPSVNVGLIGHPHEQRYPIGVDPAVGESVRVVELLADLVGSVMDLIHRQFQVA